MVRIADPIWVAWREQVERGHEPALLVLLSPAGDTGAAVTALRESVLEVQDAYEAEAQSSGDAEPPFPGEWNWVPMPDGVLVRVVECDAIETVLPAVAAGLERRGVEGVRAARPTEGRGAAQDGSPARVPRARPWRAAASRTRRLSLAGGPGRARGHPGRR